MGPPQGDPDTVEGEEGRAFHRDLNNWETGADLLVRLSLLPSRMSTLLEEAENLKSVAKESLPGRQGGREETAKVMLAADVGAGVLRVAVRTPAGDSRAWTRWIPTLTELRARLEGDGGSLVLTQGPPAVMEEVGAWGRRGEGEETLMAGLKARFDPRGIMAPGRLGL
jgi:FAD/FMN-containing dehydrogenase